MLENKVALVTGGTSGIGRATAANRAIETHDIHLVIAQVFELEDA